MWYFVKGDPVALKLVTSLNRPGGNLTGVSLLHVELGAKQLELLHEVVPAAKIAGLLINPALLTLRPSRKRCKRLLKNSE